MRNAVTTKVTAAALVLLLGAGAAKAQGADAARLERLLGRPGGLVADEVAAEAVRTSPDLRRHRAEIAEAAAQVDRAKIAFLPRLSSTAQYTRLSSIGTQSIGPVAIPEQRNRYEVDQSLTVPLLDYALKLPQSYRAARLQEASVTLSERAARLQVAADARVSYYEWARARLQRAVAEQAVEQARQHHRLAGDLFQVGNASRADVMRLEAQVASNELFLAKAEKLEAVLEDQLRTLMHDDGGMRFEIGDDLRPAVPQSGPTAPEIAWARRPDVRALQQATEAANARANVELSAALPRLDASATLTTANPNSRYFPAHDAFDTTWVAGVTLSWSPNAIADARAAARAARAKAAQSDAQRLSLQDSVRDELSQASEALRAADSALETTARGLAAAEESYRVRRELFLHGRATSVELTDAETELTQARLDAFGARIDHREALVRLDHATGRDAALAN